MEPATAPLRIIAIATRTAAAGIITAIEMVIVVANTNTMASAFQQRRQNLAHRIAPAETACVGLITAKIHQRAKLTATAAMIDATLAAPIGIGSGTWAEYLLTE